MGISDAEAESLFNGKDLSGWKADDPDADEKPDIQPSFIVRDEKLVSLGKPLGHLISEKSYENYRLTVEYRFTGKPGNCGLLVHCSTPRVLFEMFPQSIEVQMQSGHAGDFWCIGENIEVPDMEKRRPRKKGQVYGGKKGEARRIINLTDDSESKLGEWNTMVVECSEKSVKVWVNGVVVNHGTNATVSKGKIALQAEGTEVEFKKVDIESLSKN